MATYVTLVNYTKQGIMNIKESPTRLDAAKEVFKAFGAEMKQFYLAMGRYDIVLVSEAPNDEAVTKAALTIGSRGAVKTETFRVFDEDEYRNIISGIP
jgi:uncharacterized protein with GYD domain